MKSALLLWLTLALCSPAIAQAASPADMISDYRLQHGEGRVTADPTLNRIAQAQATAMASKDVLDHEVLGPFNSRVASSGSGRAAENIAYGYDSFAKTLEQWIESSGHRKNLLMHGASRIGIASAKSSTSGRTYWAMEIAGEYERPKVLGTKAPGTKAPGINAAGAKPAGEPKVRRPQACHLKILGLCL
jgi:hypothetical protein